jgi:uncharacterized protein YggU (UPF0235/DUF167 family)
VRLKVRVRAAAERHKANRALEAMLAKRLKIAKSAVRVIAGETSRNKIVRIVADRDDLARAVAGLADQ